MSKMRIIAVTMVFSIFSLIAASAPAMAGPEAGESLSITAALEMAAKSNPGYRQASLQVEKTELTKDKAAQAVSWIPEQGLVDPDYQQVVNNYQQALIGYDAARKALQAQKNTLTKDVIAAYTACLREHNNLAYARINLENTRRQLQISGIARTVGLVGDYEFDKADTGLKQVQEGVKAQEAVYESAVASLRALLGKEDGWTPELSSRPVIEVYPREALATELGRAANESILLLETKANYEIEESKQHWILPNQIFGMKAIDLELSSIAYEQARRDSKATLESLYLAIDALEAQVEAAQKSYKMAAKDLEVVQLKYELGMAAEYELQPSGSSLASARVACEKARIDLENLQSQLAESKAKFAALTGKEAYNAADWTGTEANAAAAEKQGDGSSASLN
jgi:outer membrane protein TolC